MNTFLKLGLIAATALSVFAGCAADADKDASSESDVTSRGRPGPVQAEEGAACGTGIAGIFVDCQDGLECEYGERAPGAADVMGQCVRPKLGGDGDSCGRGQPACAPTFVCVTAPDDRGGHCEPTAFGE